ncbi:TIGR04076 family protein (plasmid) [Rhodococcus sp. NJ-530]|nr:TIGR04076 family protein [Rhodococcus sp. NJ-530]
MQPTVRVMVDRADNPRCALAVGDFFDVVGSTIEMPQNKPFCAYAIAAVIPVLSSRLSDLPEDDWLERKPWICCPDPDDGVVMRLDRLDRTKCGGELDD